jgi:hypothetical protein
MPRTGALTGGTDATEPGYEELGQSDQSPEVTGNAEHPTEADYTEAMERHGTDDWTDADAAVQQAYLADRETEAKEEKDKAKTAPGETRNNAGKVTAQGASKVETTTTTKTSARP